MGISLWQLLIIICILSLFFLPTIIALKKDHRYKVAIILVNVLGGLLWGTGWLVALIWCFIEPDKDAKNISSPSEELEKLHELKEKGALTQEEFDSKKKELLEI